MSVSVINLEAGSNVGPAPYVAASTPPEPGSVEHARLMGKIKFFTALGVPDNGLVGTQLRAINPVQFRGKQSDSAWSSCASCHNDGLLDGVTWIFGDGPRQSLALDGLYSKINGAHDVRINKLDRSARQRDRLQQQLPERAMRHRFCRRRCAQVLQPGFGRRVT